MSNKFKNRLKSVIVTALALVMSLTVLAGCKDTKTTDKKTNGTSQPQTTQTDAGKNDKSTTAGTDSKADGNTADTSGSTDSGKSDSADKTDDASKDSGGSTDNSGSANKK